MVLPEQRSKSPLMELMKKIEVVRQSTERLFSDSRSRSKEDDFAALNLKLSK